MLLKRDMVYAALLLVLVMSVVDGTTIELTVEAEGYPSHFYSGTNINFTCTVSGADAIQSVALVEGSANLGCVLHRNDEWLTITQLASKWNLTQLTDDFCETTSSSFSAVGTVDKTMEGSEWLCIVDYGIPPRKTKRSPVINIGTVRERPMNLTMSSPERARKNEKITFACTSEGAKPPSEFNYKVLQADQLVSTTNNYIPQPADDGNITLECEDRIHLNLTSNVRLTKHIPLYDDDGSGDGKRSASSSTTATAVSAKMTFKAVMQASTAATQDSGKKEKKRLPAGAIAGIAIGGIVLVIALAIFTCFLGRRAGPNRGGQITPITEGISISSKKLAVDSLTNIYTHTNGLV